MLAIAVVCLMIVILTFYQVHTQGFFSTVIMAADSMIAALIAMNYYEKLAELLAGLGLAGFGLQCITLLGLFAISLLILRIITDRLIKGNMNFPVLVDRIGSAVFGLIASMIIVGMILIGFQHVAVPTEFMGFNRYPNLDKLDEDRSLFPSPDSFVLSLVNHTSDFSFSGKNNFAQHHPDMLQELYLNRVVPKNHEGSRQEAAYKALEWIDARLIDQPVRDMKTNAPVDVPAGETLVALQVKLKPGKDKASPGASDADDKIRFALSSFRLVGFEKDSSRGEGYSRYPIGYLQPFGALVDAVSLDQGKILASPQKQIDLLFHWPQNIKKSPPAYLEFKRSARAAVPSGVNWTETEREVKNLYASSNTAEQATLENKEARDYTYTPQQLTVVSYGAQPLDDMLIPTNPVMELARQTSEVQVDDGYRQLHIEPVEYNRRDQTGGFTPLHVPEGFCLLYLKIDAGGSRRGSAYVPPVLVDVYGNEHHPVGFVVTGNVGSKEHCEFAYSAYGRQGQKRPPGSIVSRPFPPVVKMLKKGGTISKIVQFYLVAQKDVPVGILGARAWKARGDAGALWRPAEGIDVVLVPAL